MPMAFRVTFEMKNPSPGIACPGSDPFLTVRQVSPSQGRHPGSRQVRTDVSHFPSRIPVSCQLR